MRKLLSAALLGFALSVGGVVIMFLFARSVSLQCSRTAPSGVMCERSASLLGIFPLGKESLTGVRQAFVQESCDDDGCTYRVALNTAQGTKPVTSYYSSGYGAKEAMAAEINAFIGGRGADTVEFKVEVGLMSLLISVALIVSGPIATFFRITRG